MFILNIQIPKTITIEDKYFANLIFLPIRNTDLTNIIINNEDKKKLNPSCFG
jgi:hypothetical protein